MFVRLFVILLFVAVPFKAWSVSEVDSLLHALDYEMSIAKTAYLDPKEARIDNLRRLLDSSTNGNDRFSYLKQLHEEYLYYQYDSAYSYARRMEKEASELGDSLRATQAQIALLECLTSVGLFHEAGLAASKIDIELLPLNERIDCYLAFAKLFQSMESYAKGSDDVVENYSRERIKCYNAVMATADSTSYAYALAELEKSRINNGVTPATTVDRCKHILASTHPGLHQKAIIYSTIGVSYVDMGMTDSAMCNLALSAMYDLRSNTRETSAAKDLAQIRLEHGDVERANRYIHQALDDAMKFNSRIRKIEINAILPGIEAARHNKLSLRQKQLIVVAALIGLLLALSLLLFFKLKKRNRILTDMHRENEEKARQLEQSNKALAEAITDLEEAKEIKDQYIIQSLYSNTDFVNEVEEKTKRALLKLKSRQYAELGGILADMGVKREQARMYTTFDNAFLKLFPNFIDELNKLLLPEHQIVLADGKLPTEVRILALMRLGIDAPANIAQYLCLSVNTVYVYKAKIKAKAAVDKNDFDARVMAIPKP